MKKIKCGTFTDSRDGKIYKIIKIGKHTWFAENLAFDHARSKIYGNNIANLAKYGRLYDWETAKKACPPGWHLPSNEEWDELLNFAGGKEIAGKKLKAKSGWNSSGNGTDNYGFSALPGGFGLSDGSFGYVGNSGHWWSASEYGSSSAYRRLMLYYYEDVLYSSSGKSLLFSVRCVQD